MEQYDELDTFEKVESWPAKIESWPTIEEIERRLRKLGCTKEQVRRHVDQVAMSRIEAAKPKPRSKSR
jgi:predicted transcriptional regulator